MTVYGRPLDFTTAEKFRVAICDVGLKSCVQETSQLATQENEYDNLSKR